MIVVRSWVADFDTKYSYAPISKTEFWGNDVDTEWSKDSKTIGLMARTPKLCSCFICNPHKYTKELSVRDAKAVIDYKEMIDELMNKDKERKSNDSN